MLTPSVVLKVTAHVRLPAWVHLLLILVTFGQTGASPPNEADYAALPNLIQNASFESDWMNNAVAGNNRFLLLDQSDWGYGQSDGLPDSWVVSHSAARLDLSEAKFGGTSLRFAKGGEAFQVVYLCGETQSVDGGGGYNPFHPLPANLAQHVHERSIRFGAWCKTNGATAAPVLSVSAEYANGEKITARQFTVEFATGTHDWEYAELIVSADAKLGVLHAAVVRVSFHGDGVAWFDGMAGDEQGSNSEPNLLCDGDFAHPDGDWVAGWSRPTIWNWVRRGYYRFTGWSHEDGAMKGGAAIVNAGPHGQRVLQLNVLPGDNLAVHSDPIALNQTEARPLRVIAWVWSDNLRWLEIMAQDEQGQWLGQLDFAGAWGSDENYRNRLIGAGTHGWEFETKYFAPRHPLKSVALWLCARGFDGRLMHRNRVGTVRFHDVELRECGSNAGALRTRGVTPARANTEPASDVHASWVVDPGERLWGLDTMQIATGVSGHITVSPVQYEIRDLCRGWAEQKPLPAPSGIFYGTPPSALTLQIDSLCVYPGERLGIGVNVNVAQASLGEISNCRVVVHHPGAERVLLETHDLASHFWKADQPRPAMLDAGYVDGRNLISISCDGAGLPLHLADDPVRDCTVVATLLGANGSVIATATSEPFGFMQKPPLPELPDIIHRTSVSGSGLLTVDDKPFFFRPFPLEKSDLGAIGRTLNFPKTHKILSLPFPKDLIFPADQDGIWKQKVQQFVTANRSDPKLFAWCFTHDGETMMWFDKWRDMAACQRKVAGWVREIDPHHVILSAEWLFGTGTLDVVSARHFNYLDELDVEPALSWLPDINAIRDSARKESAANPCVVAGLECYSYESPRDLRWRMYEALRRGASDVGICPSNMLTPSPENISFLRCLYAEELGLEPMLSGTVPSKASTCDDSEATLWEREQAGIRYLIVAGKGVSREARKTTALARPFTIALPEQVGAIDVLFEGRALKTEGWNFSDSLGDATALHVYRIRR